jgi:hypothetical protein
MPYARAVFLKFSLSNNFFHLFFIKIFKNCAATIPLHKGFSDQTALQAFSATVKISQNAKKSSVVYFPLTI